MLIRTFIFICIAVSLACSSTNNAPEAEQVFDSYEILTPIRISYGSDSLQFGELWMPESNDPATLILLIHGGCWLSQYDYTLMDSMSLDLAKRGFAVWNIEYRRTGDAGGGWPGTFLDVASSLKFVEELATRYPVNKEEIVLSGHSAGGHLSLWLATHNQMDPTSEIYLEKLPQVLGVVSLAGITDLEAYASPSGCGSNVYNLMGGDIDAYESRYKLASPIKLLPSGIPIILVNGEADNIVPVSHIEPYYEAALNKGDDITLKLVPNAGHFEVIQPGSVAWPIIIESFQTLIN